MLDLNIVTLEVFALYVSGALQGFEFLASDNFPIMKDIFVAFTRSRISLLRKAYHCSFKLL